MDEAVIDLKNVGKDYWSWKGKFTALHDVSFALRRGTVLGLLGPNGAGKTTLIKLILGLVKKNRGEMTVFGKSKVDRQVKEDIGFMPEENYLYPFLGVRETVEFSLGLYSSRDKHWDDIGRVLDMVGMGRHAAKRISECSKGMARRTALAQALVHDPQLVLLDEPTSGFDPIGMSDVKGIIRNLRERGKTVLLCSHQLADVEDVCDDVVILHKGRVVAGGPLQELLSEGGECRVVVPAAEGERLRQWLEGQGVTHRLEGAGRLEEYFIRKVGAWRED